MADNELRISEVPDGLVITGGRLDKGRLDKEVAKKAADFVASYAGCVGDGNIHRRSTDTFPR
jgi:hypothetical protein